VIVAVALCTGVAVAAVASVVVKPSRKLGPRVRPYSVASIVSLGGVPELAPATGGQLNALVGRLAERFGRLMGEAGEDEMRLKLRQADLFSDVPEERRLAAYRLRQLISTIVWIGLGFASATVLGMRTGGAFAIAGLGGIVGATRWRGRLERAIEDRRMRLRIEVYTVNQLLAMRVRVGGGVVQAVRYVVERGAGVMASELAEVLRLHRSGVPASEALATAARSTPESHVARTYWLLSSAEERGADLASALLALSEDVREARREAMRRTATKRRAAMLIPTIAILAPIMLLFVAAPLPGIVFGGL
jgi:Flp pilus assembly protein TadB